MGTLTSVGALATVDDDLWSAIGDPMRRRMLDALISRPGTATSLSEGLPVTRQAVAKHLVVLDRVGLVHSTQVGRERHYQVDEAQLARAVAQLSAVGSAWDARLQRIKRLAETIERAQGSTRATPQKKASTPKPSKKAIEKTSQKGQNNG